MDLQAMLGSLQTAKTVDPSKITLFKGQIFRGTIMKLFAGDRALVQLGGLQVHAQLEAPLEAGKSYWLQVANSKGTPQLKVLQPQNVPRQGNQSIPALFEELGLSFTKPRETVVRTLMDEKLPLSKEMIVKGGEWLKTSENKQAALETIKQMTVRQLPFTRAVFEALMGEREGTPLHDRFNGLSKALENSGETFPALRKLRELLPRLTLKPGTSGEEVKQALQQVITRLGLSFEHGLLQGQKPQLSQGLAQAGGSQGANSLQVQQETLKPLLLQVLQQTQSNEVKQQAQAMLSHITSQQLNASGQFQTVIQLPFQAGSHQSDVTIKWEGQKKQNGSLDADFCRILFYLELEHLHETAVDVNIQKRFVTVRVFNDTHDLQAVIKQFEPILRDKLELAGYHLSSLRQADGQMPESGRAREADPMSGVDFRV